MNGINIFLILVIIADNIASIGLNLHRLTVFPTSCSDQIQPSQSVHIPEDRTQSGTDPSDRQLRRMRSGHTCCKPDFTAENPQKSMRRMIPVMPKLITAPNASPKTTIPGNFPGKIFHKTDIRHPAQPEPSPSGGQPAPDFCIPAIFPPLQRPLHKCQPGKHHQKTIAII